MKKILITQRISENSSYYEIRDCLDVRWALFMEHLGYMPIILPSHFNQKVFLKELKIDGIILTGGNDLGFISKNEIDIKRDEVEKELIEFGIENRIPILGVCRGMQIIGCYFGLMLEKASNHVGRHKIAISENSLYNNVLKRKEDVNSFHGYGFTKTSNDFIITAIGNDGVIEALEHKLYKIFMHMWHPEREEPFTEVDIEFMKLFFNN